MSHALTASGDATPSRPPLLLYIALLMGGLLYWYFTHNDPPPVHYATNAQINDLHFAYEVVSEDLSVDWDGENDFDPRGRCPEDFFSAGFILVCKRLSDGAIFKFLYHKGKKLLYRVDPEIVKSKVVAGLHWVVNTRYSSRYRIADPSFKGGKAVKVPTGKGTKADQQFYYGEAVSNNRVIFNRELFRETHIKVGQCNTWADLLNFLP